MAILTRKIAQFTRKIADLADKPNLSSSSALKSYFDSSPEELRLAINGLIDDLLAITAGSSGASNIGVSSIAGLTGADVQKVIENLYSALKSVASGSSGAHLIGSPPIPGVDGSTVYAQLLSIKTLIDLIFSKIISTTPGSSGADLVGSSPIPGVTGETVFAQLASIHSQLRDVVLNQIPNGTVTDDKLSNAAGQIKDRFTAHLADYANSLNARNGMNSNALINGNFDVWEKGTTFTNTGGYLADMWKLANFADGGTLPNYTVSRQELTPGDIANSYFYQRINIDGAGSSFGNDANFIVEQPIENGTKYMCGAGKKITLSFWARSSIANKKLAFNISQEYGSGGAPSATEQLTGNTITLSSTWKKYTFTFTTNSLVGKSFGANNNDILRCRFWYMWGSNLISRFNASASESFVGSGNIDIAQIQICSGDSAIPFQPQTYAQELTLCRRYRYVITDPSNASFPVGYGYAAATTVAFIPVNLPVEMRTAPTLVATPTDWQLNDGNTAVDVTAISIQSGQNGKNILTLRATVAGGLTQFRPYSLNADINAGRMIVFSSEM